MIFERSAYVFVSKMVGPGGFVVNSILVRRNIWQIVRYHEDLCARVFFVIQRRRTKYLVEADVVI